VPRTARWPAPLLLPRSRLTVVVLHSINKYSREKPAHKGSVFTDSNLPRLCTSFTLVSNSVQKPFVCPHWIKSSAHLSFCTIRHRWLERAAAWCRRFNDRKIRKLSLAELQADEIQTIVGGKQRPTWIFVILDVWSRLWPSTVVGKRSYRNTLDLFREVSGRMIIQRVPLISTDGFKF